MREDMGFSGCCWWCYKDTSWGWHWTEIERFTLCCETCRPPEEGEVIKVRISDEAMVDLRALAKTRNDAKRFASKKKANYLTDEEIHLRGIKGDYVLCTFLGIPLDRSCLKGGDGHRPDYVLRGKTIENKTRAEGRDFALYDEKQYELKADVGTLVWESRADAQLMVIIGFVTREDFERLAVWREFPGKGKRRLVQHRNMRRFLTKKGRLVRVS